MEATIEAGEHVGPAFGVRRELDLQRVGIIVDDLVDVARMDLNGFYLIQDSVQTREGKDVFAAHGLFTYDRDDRTYKLFWHDSLGYTPPSPASGGWVGNTLTLVRGSLRGNARHVYEIIDDHSYSLKIQFSPDAEGWADVLTGLYRRLH